MALSHHNPAAVALCCLLLGLCASLAAAQSQGAALQKIQNALAPQGWTTIDPNADPCTNPGVLLPGVVCDGSSVTEL